MSVLQFHVGRGSHGSWLVRLLVVAGAFLTASPSQAAEALPPVVLDIGVSLLAAGVLGVIFARLRLPSIAAFILAGVLVGPLALDQVSDPESVDTIAQIGFVLLLFTIGLELNVRELLGSNRRLLVAGGLQFPFTMAFCALLIVLLKALGIGGMIFGDGLAPFYVGAALAGSSSLLVITLFQQHFELDTQPGRTALVVLIFQDVWAIIVMLVQPNLADPSVAPILFSFLGIAILVAVAALLARFVLPGAYRWIAKHPELTVPGALAWCFAMVVLGLNLDLLAKPFGEELHLAVGPGMAAMIAGATIASLPYSHEIVAKVGLVKDFFVTLFFVGLGISMASLASIAVPLAAVGIALLAVIARQATFVPLFYVLGVDIRTAEVASIRLSQISEFGLVIAFIGLEQGHIGADLGTVLILAFVFTAVATSPLYGRSYAIYEWLKPVLSRIGFREPSSVSDEAGEMFACAFLGYHRDAAALMNLLASRHPDLARQSLVVDFNTAVHDRIRALGAHVVYGDIASEDTLRKAGVDKVAVVLCTIPDDILRGTSNRDLVRMVRRINPSATIIATALDEGARDRLREAGANLAYIPSTEVAASLINPLAAAVQGGGGPLAQLSPTSLRSSRT